MHWLTMSLTHLCLVFICIVYYHDSYSQITVFTQSQLSVSVFPLLVVFYYSSRHFGKG